jgi:hypothetical protein
LGVPQSAARPTGGEWTDMPYARTDVRQALSMAREAGKPVEGLFAGDRETALQLERWGFLPVNRDAVDKRIQDWYVSQGLAVRGGDTPEATSDTRGDTPADTPGDTPERSRVALEAAEAALAAASAALRLARLSA